MQLQKLVRPLRMLQYNTLSPQSIESIYSCGDNGEPMILTDYRFLNTADWEELFSFTNAVKWIWFWQDFAMVQSLEFNTRKRIVSCKNIYIILLGFK